MQTRVRVLQCRRYLQHVLCKNLIGINVLVAVLLANGNATAADPDIVNYLPFQRPSVESLHASPRKVCSTWHFWRISWDNKPAAQDQYSTIYLNPSSRNGLYYGVGGELRQRPLPRPPINDPNWKTIDMQTDVWRARAIGLDCFFFSLYNVTTGWDALLQMLNAANNVDKQFKIVPMIDGASLQNNHPVPSPEFVADKIATIANNPAIMRDESGRVVVGADGAELMGTVWWEHFKARLTNNHLGVSLQLQLNWSEANARTYTPMADVIGGQSSAVVYEPTYRYLQDRIANTHTLNKKYMASVFTFDFRPRRMRYWESNNTEAFRSNMLAAMNYGADKILIKSWNDRQEYTDLSPSTGTQWALYDLAAYYITWFKTRQQPVITRDTLYYCHRLMRTTTPFNRGKQSGPFVNGNSSHPDRNDIELLAFLTQPGELQIKTDKVQKMSAPAGITSFKVPLVNGKPVFSLVRGGQTKISFQSQFNIRDTTTWQDLGYRCGDSTRPVVEMVANPPVTN